MASDETKRHLVRGLWLNSTNEALLASFGSDNIVHNPVHPPAREVVTSHVEEQKTHSTDPSTIPILPPMLSPQSYQHTPTICSSDPFGFNVNNHLVTTNNKIEIQKPTQSDFKESKTLEMQQTINTVVSGPENASTTTFSDSGLSNKPIQTKLQDSNTPETQHTINVQVPVPDNESIGPIADPKLFKNLLNNVNSMVSMSVTLYNHRFKIFTMFIVK
mmetsp:Transcript_26708/g.41440  ORF Transcript_26708/g.41440 Transcript_26708/m.41440 type:complete len:217 (-) Transcript_26708:365-1015(-)|eukprot:CAMPEP_0196800950 /NCGR_PEP_ID=MMETSP1362-20130617/543_1 /TAXON_ID=163516 /ORGANISM="Leptocylindrus danicus, Strain CCMP1856" /LENGTH=216 /DNA_ID=CAMNT_0042171589 /DNA_START=30 /DNA_END=680 /DNA_ORIENTATION=-